MFLNARVVHSLEPVVVAVAVNEITTFPVASMSFSLPPLLLNRMKPAGGVPSTTQVRAVGPGSVAVTVIALGVPAPVGIATVTDPSSWALSAALVTVIEYATAVPTVAVVGLIDAE